jgi:hypothetical protein
VRLGAALTLLATLVACEGGADAAHDSGSAMGSGAGPATGDASGDPASDPGAADPATSAGIEPTPGDAVTSAASARAAGDEAAPGDPGSALTGAAAWPPPPVPVHDLAEVQDLVASSRLVAPFALAPFPQTCTTDAPLADLDRFVAALPGGASVRLAAGTIDTSLILSRSLRLEAAGSRPVLQGVDGRFGATILVDAPGARIELVGVVLSSPSDGPALVVERGTVVLERCVVLSDARNGVVLKGPDAHLIMRDTLVTTGEGTGLQVGSGSTAALDNSEFVRCHTAVNATFGLVSAHRLRVARCRGGITVGSGRLDLRDSTVWGQELSGVTILSGSVARLVDVEIRAPGGAPALRFLGESDALIQDCVLMGTPAEVDHHAGEVNREHLERELTVGIDHHVLESLVEVLDGAAPHMRRCRLENALGHGLHVQEAGGRFEQVTITGSVMFGMLFEDDADPELIDCLITGSGENGLFSWRGAKGRVTGGAFGGNGRFGEGANGWAQVVLTEGARTVLRDVEISDGVAGGVDASGVETLAGLAGCTLTRNGGDGLRIHVGATAVLERAVVTDNGGAGLRATSGSVVELDRCTLSRNGGEGVRVQSAARVTLDRAVVEANRRYGVVFDGGSSGSLIDSVVEDNRVQDVVIGEGADVDGGAGP